MSNNTFNKKNNDLIRYDQLAQNALRGVVKQVIEEIAEIGELPGNHHFYITFDTNDKGVKLSKEMKQKYPNEMTIVIQHQYWDLKTNNNGFAITLSFNDKAEKIKVPYNAIKGFFDPSVEFGLQFETENIQEQKIKENKTQKQNNQSSAEIVSIEKFRKK